MSAQARTSQPAPVPTTAPAGPVTNRDKARALLAMLDPGAAQDGAGTPPKAGAPLATADLRAIARDLIAQVEGKVAKPPAAPSVTPDPPPAPRPAGRHATVPQAPEPTPASPPAPPTSPPRMLDIPQEAPGTASPDAPPLILSDGEMILPTFASGGRPAARAEPGPAATSLFSRRAPLTLSVPRSESREHRITLSVPSGFTPDPMPRVRLRSPSLPRSDLKSLITATVAPHRLAAEHPSIVALTLEGLPPLEQAGALRKLPHGQRRRVHRALRQIETATT